MPVSDDILIDRLRTGLTGIGAEAPSTVALEPVRREGRRRRRVVRGVTGGGLGLAVVALIVAVVLVGGSASRPGTLVGTGEPAATANMVMQDPTALVGSWRVTGAAGEEPGAVLDLGDQLGLYRPCGVYEGQWRASVDGRFLAYVNGASGPCSVTATGPVIGWLDDAASFRVVSDGSRQLLSSTGSVLATLLPGGRPPVRQGYLRTPPTLTSALRTRLAPGASLPAGATPATTSDVIGRWVSTDPAVDPAAFVEFSADGRYSSSDGCNGRAGRWSVGPGGDWLSLGGFSSEVGCNGQRDLTPGDSVRHVAIDGTTLTFYDTNGKVSETLRSATLDAGTLRELAARASEAATADGDPGATGQVVRTTRARALGVLGGELVRDSSAHDTVYVIQLMGSFVCRACNELEKSGPPTGTSLQLVVGADLYEVELDTFGNKPVDLSTLGPVNDLPH